MGRAPRQRRPALRSASQGSGKIPLWGSARRGGRRPAGMNESMNEDADRSKIEWLRNDDPTPGECHCNTGSLGLVMGIVEKRSRSIYLSS